MGRRRLSPLWAPIVALLMPAAASAEGLAAFFSRLERLGKKTRVVTGTFTQKKTLALFSAPITTRGRFTVSGAQTIRWETFAPDASVLLLDAAAVEIRVPGQKMRRIALGRAPALRALIGDLAAWLGAAGTSRLRQRYAIKLGDSRGGEVRLTLVPKGDAALKKRVAQVILRFDAALAPRSILLVEPSGDRTAITFADLKRR